MTSTKTVAPDQPQAVPDLGRFADYSNEALAGQCRMQAREAMDPDLEAFMYAVAARLAARPVLPVETPAEGLREALSDSFLKDVTQEYLSYRGERPNRVLRGGQELWEAHVEAIKAGLQCAIRLASTAPTPLSGRDGSLREALVSMVTDYLQPATYVRRFPADATKWATEFEMPHEHASENGKRNAEKRRDAAFIADVIRLQEPSGQAAALAAVSPETAEMEGSKTHCTTCDGTGDVHRADGEWLGECDCEEGRKTRAADRLAARASSSGEAGDD